MSDNASQPPSQPPAQPTRTPSQIEADLGATRDRLVASVEALIDQVHPNRIKQRQIDNVKRFANTELENAKSKVFTARGDLRVGRVASCGCRSRGCRWLLVDHPRHRATWEERLSGGRPKRPREPGGLDEGGLPIRMLHDRVLVSTDNEPGERRSSGGILIPATVAIGRRLAWGEVVAVGTHVRTVKPEDRVLFDPEDRAEVEVRGQGLRAAPGAGSSCRRRRATPGRENRPLPVSRSSQSEATCAMRLL